MSIENKEIGEIIKKCKILLLDIEGTTTSISFVKDKLFPYAEANVKQFLASQWETVDVKEAVAALRQLALDDKENKVDGVVDIPGEEAEKDAQIEGLVGSVKWQMSLDRKSGPLKQLQGLIWKQGYDNGEIKGHVYEDVSPAIELWRSVAGQKVYIYSSGSVQAQKLLFGQSTAGDMLPMIDGHFDTAVGGKREAASYTAIVEKIGCKPDEVLFLTDIVEEASAARAAGLHAALVTRDSPPESPAAAPFPSITSFAQLAVSNKRKTDAQVEEPASKVAKTGVEVDPKTAAAQIESAATETPAVEEAHAIEIEKMEVEGVEVATEAKEEPMKVETVVEDITDTTEPIDAPEVQAEPVVIEAKTDNKTEEPEKEQASKTVITETKTENGDEPAKEPSPETVITEIEEDVSDKLGDAPEVIDMVPVVEEPAAEMVDLQNVGEVLEKECDEILSKVQDVTNLDNIPVKPILNSIPEETMETENTDSNDIVDKILDTEIEMGIKQTTESESKETACEVANKLEEESKPVPDTNNSEIDDKNTSEVITGDKQTAVVTEEEKVTSNGTTEKESEPSAEQKEKPEISATDKPVETTPTVTVDEKATETTPAATTEAVPESTAEPASKTDTELKVENETKLETETKEPHVNGKTTNGGTVAVNGGAKVDGLNDRLAENGSALNGDKKVDAEVASSVPEIKSKPLPTATDTTEPIQQATEA